MAGLAVPTLNARRVFLYGIMLGLFFTFRGYRSREVDQAYRLPILLHQQAPRLYDADPFVRAFDHFNPHRGYLAVLNLASHAVGLSAALAGLFGLTFLVTVYGLDRLASAVWDDRKGPTGLIAASLALVAMAGNVGTNHLFEPMLLERMIAFGLGWVAFAVAIGNGRRRVECSALLIGLAAFVHPSVGLQLALLLGASWVAWRLVGRSGEVDTFTTFRALFWLSLAVLPGELLNLRGSGLLLEGLSPEDVRLLSVELQGPQHMLPHLWRLPQWLAWGCYPLLALCACFSMAKSNLTPVRTRFLVLLGVNFIGLAVAWWGVEWLQNLRLTLFQPFRMATVARGLCLVLVAGHVRRLWRDGADLGRLRASLIAVGLIGDWMLVAASTFEAAMSARDAWVGRESIWWRRGRVAGWVVLASGLIFLARHDTESGHGPMLAAVAAGLGLSRIGAGAGPWTRRRYAVVLGVSWAVPIAALAANLTPDVGNSSTRSIRQALIRRCRFLEVPVDDLERVADWCRTHTPEDARFIGPPGPKTFRLWSRRSLAFNRAGSPYHAEGLADWSRRFRDHVGYRGTVVEFVRAYQRDRHGLERGYDRLSPAEKAALADRQGADYVLATAPGGVGDEGGPLEWVHTEGKYAVYRVNRSVARANTPVIWR